MPGSAKKIVAEEVLREFPPIGKYRVRILKGKGAKIVDIREYVSTETFEGFTRRGIRLSAKADLEMLRSHLSEVLDGK